MPKRKRTADVVEAIKATALSGLADSGLTLKRQRFVCAFIETGNASEAYRRSHSAENMCNRAIRVEAYRLRRNPRVALAIERRRHDMAAGTEMTFGTHMAELAQLRDTAVENRRYGAAVRAEELRGKLAGLYPKQRR